MFNNFGADGIHPVWRSSGEGFSGECLQITVRQSEEPDAVFLIMNLKVFIYLKEASTVRHIR